MVTQRALPDPEQEPTITVPAAGRIFGLSRPSAYEAARRGEIPTIRIGRRLLVPTIKFLRMLGYDEVPASDAHAPLDD
jgi:hypothetical protein